MKAKIAALMILSLMQTLLMAEAQQPDSLKPNSSYQCNDDMTLTVVRCAQQDGQEYCEFKLEQKGKLSFQGLAPKENVRARREARKDPSGKSDEPVSAHDGRTGQKFQSALSQRNAGGGFR